MCPACQVDAHSSFWERRIYLNHRLDLHWDRVENSATSIWSGDHGEDFRARIVESPFVKAHNPKEKTYDLLESGQGKRHTCVQGRIPATLPIEPFLPAERSWTKKGNRGYFGKIEISVMGMVEQNPEGKWQWITSELFSLPIPPPLSKVFGEKLVVDGWFRLCGERMTRRKRRSFEFQEKNPGKINENVPEGTRIEIEWVEKFVPATCHGITVWGLYAKLIEWKSWD